jgi:phosphate transport system protein
MALRINFAEELHTAESDLLAQGREVRTQLDRVMEALDRCDADLARAVVSGDDGVDELYLASEARILKLLALQTPVAKDLRLVSAVMHSTMHLERMGDLCVNIAKFVLNEMPYPRPSPMLSRLQEMGTRAGDMLEIALKAFAVRDVSLAEQLPVKDNALDRLNRGILADLKEYAGDEQSFEWATNLVLVARYLERFGDHAVDIGEQTHFLVTGVFKEFTDASHPDAELT